MLTGTSPPLPNHLYHIITFNLLVWSGQVRHGGIRRSSASARPSCDGTRSASVWPSSKQTPCPYSSDMTPPDATKKRVDAPSAWSSHLNLDKKISDRRDPPQGVAPNLACPTISYTQAWKDCFRIVRRTHSRQDRVERTEKRLSTDSDHQVHRHTVTQT